MAEGRDRGRKNRSKKIGEEKRNRRKGGSMRVRNRKL